MPKCKARANYQSVGCGDKSVKYPVLWRKRHKRGQEMTSGLAGIPHSKVAAPRVSSTLGFQHMDRTGIAAIIIGFGATVAAMVMPQKYPQAPKWAVELSWWGGVILIVAGCIILFTEFTVADLGEALHAWSDWIWNYAVWLAQLPASWVVAAFLTGVAVHRWHGPVLKAMRRVSPAAARVENWYAPAQAAERFVKAEVVAADRAAQEKVKQIREEVERIETSIEGELEPENALIQEQLATEKSNLDDALYVASRRRTDLVEHLRITLKMGLLVGKGRKLVKRRGNWISENEAFMPLLFWGYLLADTDVLDLEKQTATSVLGCCDEVFIGRDENWKEPPSKSSA